MTESRAVSFPPVPLPQCICNSMHKKGISFSPTIEEATSYPNRNDNSMSLRLQLPRRKQEIRIRDSQWYPLHARRVPKQRHRLLT